MAPPLSQQAHRESKAILVGALLILLVGGYFVGRFFWKEQSRDEENTEVTAPEKSASEMPGFMEPKTLTQKFQNQDKIVIVDIRPKEAYETEHIPGSLSASPGTLGNLSSDPETAVVIVTSTLDTSTLEVANNLLTQKGIPFSFLQGGFEAWKLEGYQTISRGDPDSFVDQSKVTYISPAELKTLLQTSAATLVLLDVQPEEKFRSVHLTGALNIPLEQLEKRKNEIPTGKTVVVYGENELAAFQGGVRLSDLHFFSVRTLTGNDHLSSASPLFREP